MRIHWLTAAVWLMACLLMVVASVQCATDRRTTDIDGDERVVFFSTWGALAPDGKNWQINVHGWIHEAEGRSLSRRATLATLRKSLGIAEDSETSSIFQRRARAFLVDNERGQKVPIRLAGETYVPGESQANGHFTGSFTVPARRLSQTSATESGKDRWITFRAETKSNDHRVFQGSALLMRPSGLSVISDIDDTVKISNVRNKKELLANTFLRQFRAVPGMSELYRRWAEAGASFHYVSASPWQLYESLSEFLREEGFPAGTFHMRLFRPKDSSFFDLFAAPERTKRRAIEPLLRAFPQRKFILVGDSGEKDPEIYAALAREHPEQIARILIRDVTDEPATSNRYRTVFAGIPRDRWTVFKDPKGIAVMDGGFGSKPR